MVILGWGWVGWGGAMTFMSTCTHTSCYVIAMFSCTCTHTSCYVIVIFSCTCSHTSCYAMVNLEWGWVGWGGQWRSCQLAHTHVMLRYCYVLLHFLAHTRHATLWWSSLALAHVRHATLWLSWGGVGWGGAITFMSTCTHTHTRPATFLLCRLALAHTRHATLWWFSLALAHTRHATLWLSWGGVGWGGVGQ